jgi:hypothetical protein
MPPKLSNKQKCRAKQTKSQILGPTAGLDEGVEAPFQSHRESSLEDSESVKDCCAVHGTLDSSAGVFLQPIVSKIAAMANLSLSLNCSPTLTVCISASAEVWNDFYRACLPSGSHSPSWSVSLLPPAPDLSDIRSNFFSLEEKNKLCLSMAHRSLRKPIAYLLAFASQ